MRVRVRVCLPGYQTRAAHKMRDCMDSTRGGAGFRLGAADSVQEMGLRTLYTRCGAADSLQEAGLWSLYKRWAA